MRQELCTRYSKINKIKFMRQELCTRNSKINKIKFLPRGTQSLVESKDAQWDHL